MCVSIDTRVAPMVSVERSIFLISASSLLFQSVVGSQRLFPKETALHSGVSYIYSLVPNIEPPLAPACGCTY